MENNYRYCLKLIQKETKLGWDLRQSFEEHVILFFECAKVKTISIIIIKCGKIQHFAELRFGIIIYNL